MKKFTLASAFCLLFAFQSIASEPTIWSVNSRTDVLKGDSRGVSIDANGTITIAPKLTEVFKSEQPYVWSSTLDASGSVYLGTGGDGRIFKVAANGTGALFADLNELNVTGLTIGRSGELFAATSPDGKVYRLDTAGKAEVYFDPKEKYIWALAATSDGSLAVATGENGKIFRVRAANATPESSLLFDTSETHIISLAVDAQGNLYAGTDSNGLVLRFGPDGRPFALLDSPLREIHELAVSSNGSVYALALGESASSGTAPVPTASPSPDSKAVSVEKQNPMTPEPPQKSRYDLTSAKSAVYRILPDGGADIIWSSGTVTGFSIYAHQTGNGVLLGTSDKGRIYSISNEGRETLALQSDASQISTIKSLSTNLYATTSNQGRLLKIGTETLSEGIYESAVLDAKSAASWGSIWWRSTGSVQIESRSGNTEDPNETWTAWNSVGGTGQRGQIGSPRSRYLQWRAILKTGQVPAVLNEVNVAYIARNIAPEITSISLLPANVGLLANPPIQIDPNIELSGLDPLTFGIQIAPVPPRRAYQRGARAFQWTAEDRNGDKLLYDIYYKESAEGNYKLLRQDLPENFFSVDGLSLPDGRYTIRIVANDAPGNPIGSFLTGERVSEPFDIDNTQPTVAVSGQPLVTGERVRVVFAANDRSSYLARAEYSINGGEWRTVFADDGISDGPDERYTVDLQLPTAGEYSITLRVFDASGNIGNGRTIVRR